jgi:DNA helicase II / ATP-dependent DNA helicase PcrA
LLLFFTIPSFRANFAPMDILDGLNDVQRAAVISTDGPTLVIAGPGSGKTRVLTMRIAHLLKNGVHPRQILTLTFTNKAAREMKERITKVVGPVGEQVWAGTFHSIFARILRAEATKIGYPSNFTVYDSDDSMSLIRTLIKEAQLDSQVYNASALRSRISLAKSNLLTPQAYRDNADWMTQDRQAKRPFIVDVYEKYMQRCKLAGAMDFDDLLLQLFRLFRDNPDNVVEKYRERFKYVHVDEFQDTNFLQYAILRRLVKYEGSPENLFVVGDDAQSIYAFRGATIDNILDFNKDYPNLRTLKLEQNYRSTSHIVEAANEVISYNRKQLQKTIWTDKTDSAKIKLIKTLTDDEEAKRVVDLILEQKNRYHLPNSELAILYRTNAQSRKFEEHLRRQNLPYRVYGGMSFYQRKEVKDFVSYLRLAVNPTDEEALRRVINFPTRGISDATVEKLSLHANQRNEPIWTAMLSMTDLNERAKKAIAGFRNLVMRWHQSIPTSNAHQLATDILRQSGLLELLRSDTSPEGISRLENVTAVIDAIAEFSDGNTNSAVIAGIEDNSDKSLAAYLQTVTLLTDADDDNKGTETITLMSVHSAKGLEYRSVFVTGMEDQLFPSFMSFEDPNGMDEERRLFYVAITRAKELLTLSFSQNRYRNGQLRSYQPSRFLEEINQAHFEVTGSLGSNRAGGQVTQSLSPDRPSAGVSGIAIRRNNGPLTPAITATEMANFKASSTDEIVKGATVLHQKFGRGQVLSVEGPRDGKIAAIQFEGDSQPERRIVLKFAKLQVLN